MLVAQSKKLDRLQAKIDELTEQLDNKIIILNRAGSISQAAMALSHVFDNAQAAADLYVQSVCDAADRYAQELRREAEERYGLPDGKDGA